MAQLSDTEAAGAVIEPDDAPAQPKTGDELADDLGLEPDEPEEDEQSESEEDEQEDEPPEPAIDPPASWKADAKELFAQLPPEMQKVVSEREAQREAFVQTKAQEAANTRMAVENEARAVIAQQSQRMAQELQQYASMVTPQRPDPAMLQYDPQGFYLAQSQYEAAIAQRTEHHDRRSEMWHAAKIPASVMLKWRIEHGIDCFDPNHAQGVRRLLNSSEYRHLRRTPFQI